MFNAIKLRILRFIKYSECLDLLGFLKKKIFLNCWKVLRLFVQFKCLIDGILNEKTRYLKKRPMFRVDTVASFPILSEKIHAYSDRNSR